MLGPELKPGEASIWEAADVVPRALETFRLMNTAVMNGNGGRRASVEHRAHFDHRQRCHAILPTIVRRR